MLIKDPAQHIYEGMYIVENKIKGGLKAIGDYTKEVLAETGEGASISYSLMAVLAQYSKLRSVYGYGVVALGGTTALIMEILKSTKTISEKRYHLYRIIKESIAGATVAAIFTEGFLQEDLQSVAIAAAIVVGLSVSKAVLEILRMQRGHQSKAHKMLDYTLSGVYSLLMGAGITDYFFKIWEGFGVEVPEIIALTVTASVAFLTFLSEMPTNKLSGEDGKRHRFYSPARTFSSGVYASDINLFLTIFLFDVIASATRSTRVSNLEFALVLAAAIIGWCYTFYRKLTNDKKEDHDLVEHGGIAVAHSEHDHHVDNHNADNHHDHHQKDEIKDEHQPLLHHNQQQEPAHYDAIVNHGTKVPEEETHHHDIEAQTSHAADTHADTLADTQPLIDHEQTPDNHERKASCCSALMHKLYFWKQNEREMHSKTLVNVVASQHLVNDQEERIQILEP